MSGFRDRLSRNPLTSPCQGAVKTESLLVESRSVNLDDSLQVCAAVKNGLASIADADPLAARMSLTGETDKTVREISLLENAVVFELALSGKYDASIREEALSFGSFPGIHSLKFNMGEVRVREVFPGFVPGAKDGGRFLIAYPAIPIPRYKIARLLHTRRSVRMETLEDSERNSFLREAEILKGVRPDRAELLAVFRRVPIEVISRLRFVAETKIIRYSVVEGLVPTSTRVHDMAAVRDTASGEVFLLPHRTKFRAVPLN